MNRYELKTFLVRRPLVSHKPFDGKVMCVIADKPSRLAFVRTAADARNRKGGSIANA